MKRVTRDRPLTAEEVAELKVIREQIAADLPELIAQSEAMLSTLKNVRKIPES